MQLNTGVFEAELPLSDAPVLGEWTITAELDDEVIRDCVLTTLHCCNNFVVYMVFALG